MYPAPAAYGQEKIRIGISAATAAFLPTIVAEKKGFYTKYGLTSEHIHISMAAVGMNALGTGDLDYGVTLAQGVAAAMRGVPVKITMMTQDKLVFFLIVKPNIQKVADLKGKTVGISYLGGTIHVVGDVIFRKYGLVPGKDLNLLPSGDERGRLAAMDQGLTDALIGSPPLNIHGAKRGNKILLWARDHVNLPQNGLIVSEKKLQQSPDQVKRVIKGTIEALQFIKDRREESIDILAKWTKADKETATAMFDGYAAAYSTDGTMTDEALQAAIDDAASRAKPDKKITISHIATRTILSEAQKELGLKK
ncbi:MAG: hypothetical protein A2X67_15370 [Ignavibacteria bacterium GWA2_55_11]|nr:MAG: hypothetical protein A2X67_15370 [Ignavibacteria bacterium GWA2_55_11]